MVGAWAQVRVEGVDPEGVGRGGGDHGAAHGFAQAVGARGAGAGAVVDQAHVGRGIGQAGNHQARRGVGDAVAVAQTAVVRRGQAGGIQSGRSAGVDAEIERDTFGRPVACQVHGASTQGVVAIRQGRAGVGVGPVIGVRERHGAQLGARAVRIEQAQSDQPGVGADDTAYAEAGVLRDHAVGAGATGIADLQQLQGCAGIRRIAVGDGGRGRVDAQHRNGPDRIGGADVACQVGDHPTPGLEVGGVGDCRVGHDVQVATCDVVGGQDPACPNRRALTQFKHHARAGGIRRRHTAGHGGQLEAEGGEGVVGDQVAAQQAAVAHQGRLVDQGAHTRAQGGLKVDGDDQGLADGAAAAVAFDLHRHDAVGAAAQVDVVREQSVGVGGDVGGQHLAVVHLPVVVQVVEEPDAFAGLGQAGHGQAAGVAGDGVAVARAAVVCGGQGQGVRLGQGGRGVGQAQIDRKVAGVDLSAGGDAESAAASRDGAHAGQTGAAERTRWCAGAVDQSPAGGGQIGKAGQAIDHQGTGQAHAGGSEDLVVHQAVAVGVQVHHQGAAGQQVQAVADRERTGQGTAAQALAWAECAARLDRDCTGGAAVAGQGGTGRDRQGRGGQAAVEFEHAAVEGGGAGVGVGTREDQVAAAGLDQAADAGNDATELAGELVGAGAQGARAQHDRACARERAHALVDVAQGESGAVGHAQCGLAGQAVRAREGQATGGDAGVAGVAVGAGQRQGASADLDQMAAARDHT